MADKVGKVSFFDTSKGFGFIIDTTSQEKYFVHVSGLLEEIKENDKVTFELEKGMKGMNAVRVHFTPKAPPAAVLKEGEEAKGTEEDKKGEEE